MGPADETCELTILASVRVFDVATVVLECKVRAEQFFRDFCLTRLLNVALHSALVIGTRETQRKLASCYLCTIPETRVAIHTFFHRHYLEWFYRLVMKWSHDRRLVFLKEWPGYASGALHL